MGALLDLVLECAFSSKKKVPQSSNVLPARGPRFLAPNVEGVIPAQRRIRIFGKRFMESEMGSILVKVLQGMQNVFGSEIFRRLPKEDLYKIY